MTPDILAAATGISLALAKTWHGPLKTTFDEYGIDTPHRMAAFLAQVGHESAGFRYTVELWGPTAAQQGYEGRADLGNTEPGDGYRYRGRGLIQVTGRANYRKAGKALGVDLEQFPDLLAGHELAARSAGWYWQSRGLNRYADNDDFERLTRAINGGLNGYEDRVRRLTLAEKALCG